VTSVELDLKGTQAPLKMELPMARIWTPSNSNEN